MGLGIDYRSLKRIPYLILLMRNGVSDAYMRPLSLSRIAEEIGTTPQNVSKIINRLEDDGLVVKEIVNGQLMVRFTPRASEVLRFVIDVVRDYLKDKLTVRLVGRVVSGIGEGSFYMSLEGYVKQFEEKLGFRPYPGTLNLELRREYMTYRLYLNLLPGIYIHGFSNGKRTYGGVKCFRATIRGLTAGVLVIERTHHGPEILEVISPYKLRDALGLRDGDEVEVMVDL